MADQSLSDIVREQIASGAVTREEITACIGKAPVTLRKLMAGERTWKGIGIENLRALAELLKLPPVSVFLLAGVLMRGDFLLRTEKELVMHRLDQYRRDPNLGGLLPPQDVLEAAPDEVKSSLLLFVRLAATERARRSAPHLSKEKSHAQCPA